MSYEYQNLPIKRDDAGDTYVSDHNDFVINLSQENRDAIENIIPDGAGGELVEGQEGEVVPEEKEAPEVEPSEGEEIYDINIDPVTRVAGALAFHAQVDLAKGEVEAAHSQATLFRGYEIILEGRDPRDAIDLSSRACGVCGATHSINSAYCLEMAFDVEPPPLGLWVRNIGQSAIWLYDHTIHLQLLAGVDYSEALLGKANPDLFSVAEGTSAPNEHIHGYETVGEIMRALNPLEGELYLEGLEKTRLGRQMGSLMLGKFPHPSTIAPGGVTTTVTKQTFSEFYTRLHKFFDWTKRMTFIWQDLMEFMLEYQDGFEDVGRRPVSVIDPGCWDDPSSYNARYEDAGSWGRDRLATPCVIVDGELKTTDLRTLDQGVEEFIDASFYEDWTDEPQRWQTTPNGDPISPYHPFNKTTHPKPEGKSWRDKYTWATAPRWDRTPMESGPWGRMLGTAMAEEIDNPFIEATGDGINMTVPEGRELPEMDLRWEVPDVMNAATRHIAKAYHLPYVALVSYTGFLECLDLLKQGHTDVHTPFKVPQKGTHRGVGWHDAGRGYLTHHMTMTDGTIDNYQMVTPSTWNAAPRDPFGQPGPYEEGALNTPLLENYTDQEDFTGIDILRGVRSFDPCMPCTVHLHSDSKRDLIAEDVSSCGCSFTEGDEPADEAIRDIIAGAD